MIEPVFASPLAHRSPAENTSIDLHEITTRGMIDLRGLANDRKFMAAAKQVLGLDLPKAPRSSVSWGDMKALWLSPDQWLILCARDKAPTLLDELNKALAGIHSLAVDVSDMRCVIHLEGEGVRETMMKGCSLDLLSDDYEPGTVRRVRFAEIAGLLHVVEQNAIDLYVFRSYADYTWDFLLKAARKGSELRLFSK